MDIDVVKEVLGNAIKQGDIEFVEKFFEYLDSAYIAEMLQYEWLVYEMSICPECFKPIDLITLYETHGYDGVKFITEERLYAHCDKCSWEL